MVDCVLGNIQLAEIPTGWSPWPGRIQSGIRQYHVPSKETRHARKGGTDKTALDEREHGRSRHAQPDDGRNGPGYERHRICECNVNPRNGEHGESDERTSTPEPGERSNAPATRNGPAGQSTHGSRCTWTTRNGSPAARTRHARPNERPTSTTWDERPPGRDATTTETAAARNGNARQDDTQHDTRFNTTRINSLGSTCIF